MMLVDAMLLRYNFSNLVTSSNDSSITCLQGARAIEVRCALFVYQLSAILTVVLLHQEMIDVMKREQKQTVPWATA